MIPGSNRWGRVGRALFFWTFTNIGTFTIMTAPSEAKTHPARDVSHCEPSRHSGFDSVTFTMPTRPSEACPARLQRLASMSTVSAEQTLSRIGAGPRSGGRSRRSNQAGSQTINITKVPIPGVRSFAADSREGIALHGLAADPILSVLSWSQLVPRARSCRLRGCVGRGFRELLCNSRDQRLL